MRVHLGLAVAAALMATAPAAAAPPVFDAAPGRVLFSPADIAFKRSSIDPIAGGLPVALPDAGLLIVGFGDPRGGRVRVTKLDARGALDPRFGEGGIASASLPIRPHQVLRQPDGRIVLVGVAADAGPFAFSPQPLVVARLNADATVDRSFGQGGIVTTPIGLGCACPQTAALAPDGAIVLTGATGTFPRNPQPDTVPDVRWSVTRLLASGVVDPMFGTHGVAEIASERAFGFNVGVLPDGRIITQGQTAGTRDTHVLLARLGQGGAVDGSFGDGRPVTAPLALGMLALFRPDGSVVLGGSEPGQQQPPFSAGARAVAAFTAAGALDAGFGRGGVVALGNRIELTQLLALPGNRLLVAGRPTGGLLLASGTPATLLVDTWEPSGPVAGRAPGVVQFPFGGGFSGFVVSRRPRPLPRLAQNSFNGQTLTQRPDGSYVAVGAVSIGQPTGEGTGYSLGRTGVAALTPALALDRSFGGPDRRPGGLVTLARQRVRTALARHGIRVRLRSSAVGLWRVRIRDGRGRTLAKNVVPGFETRPHTMPVELTHTGNRVLRGRRRLTVTVTATLRDLFGALVTRTTRGTLG